MPHQKRDLAVSDRCQLSVINGRWKGTILWCLLDGPMRPAELERSISQITDRRLIRPLQELGWDGVLVGPKSSVETMCFIPSRITA